MITQIISFSAKHSIHPVSEPLVLIRALWRRKDRHLTWSNSHYCRTKASLDTLTNVKYRPSSARIPQQISWETTAMTVMVNTSECHIKQPPWYDKKHPGRDDCCSARFSAKTSYVDFVILFSPLIHSYFSSSIVVLHTEQEEERVCFPLAVKQCRSGSGRNVTETGRTLFSIMIGK